MKYYYKNYCELDVNKMKIFNSVNLIITIINVINLINIIKKICFYTFDFFYLELALFAQNISCFHLLDLLFFVLFVNLGEVNSLTLRILIMVFLLCISS